MQRSIEQRYKKWENVLARLSCHLVITDALSDSSQPTADNNITTIEKIKLEWCKEIRYLGVYITASNVYCCSFKYTKQAVYRSVLYLEKLAGLLVIKLCT